MNEKKNNKVNINEITSARRFAFELLQKAHKNNSFSNILLDSALEGTYLSSPDKALACTLFYGVIEKRITLDYQISRLSSRPIESIDSATLFALRMGLYQLIFLDKIPPHAAIYESVELCPKKSAGFANAILRSFTRSQGVIYPSEDDYAEYLSVRFSVGRPLCEKFISAYGKERAASILAAFDEVPQTTLRINTLKTNTQKWMGKAKDAELCTLAKNAVKIRGSVRAAYGFDKGYFFVQDEASQLCVKALDAKEGQTVMDICACPGSKSFGAAIGMNNVGEIYAFDLHAKKLSLIESGAKRLGIDIIKVAECDGRNYLPEFCERADRVLCDVPCSGFGVIAKKPELRYKDPKESEQLPKIQYDILSNASRYVKRGGTLVYSTCTVFSEENEDNINKFLAEHPEFSLCPIRAGNLFCEKGYITLLPDEHHTDGFFIAKLKRK